MFPVQHRKTLRCSPAAGFTGLGGGFKEESCTAEVGLLLSGYVDFTIWSSTGGPGALDVGMD